MAETIEVKVPDIGDYHDVPVIEVLVKEGDRVEPEAPLITLESEKATMDVPAPEAGTIKTVKVKVGDKVSQGTAICEMEISGIGKAEAGAAKVPSPPWGEGQGEGQKPAKPAAAPLTPEPLTPTLSPEGRGRKEAGLSPEGRGGEIVVAPGPTAGPLPHASPSVRKFARALGVDLQQVPGSGPHGRILREDVQGFVKKSLGGGRREAGGGIPAIPEVDFSQWGEIETKPLPRIRKLSAQHLHRAWLNVPHVTQTDEADITELEAFRKSQSAELAQQQAAPKLTLLPFVMKAVAVAIKQYPDFNTSLAPDGENLIHKKYCHIGFAADTENGLVVPVVRDANRKGIVQLAKECAALAAKARDGKLKSDEMKGGCFSISSLGGIGGRHFTPIVNAPEVAILGVSRAVMKPVWNGAEFRPRLMLPLSLSYDHRVIDGAYAARCIVHLVKLLEDARRLAL